MKTQHIRFSDAAVAVVSREADHLEVSFAAFVRSASLVAATIVATRRGAPLQDIYPELLALALAIDAA